MSEISTLTLAEVETAIRNILAGSQEFNIKGKNIRFADLNQLQALRSQLIAEANAADRAEHGGLTNVNFNNN